MKKTIWYLKVNGPFTMFRIFCSEAGMFIRSLTVKKLINFLRCAIDKKRERADVGSYPYSYYIEPTNTCNLRCPFCCATKLSLRNKGFMDRELFKQIINDISPYAIRINLYLRGESFLHKDLLFMIEYAKKSNIAVKIATNMHFMDETTAQALVKAKLDRLIVEIDGIDQETYSTYRVGGSLEKVLSNLGMIRRTRDRLKSRYPALEVRTIIMKKNENILGDIRDLAFSNGADNVFFVPMFMDAKNDRVYVEWAPSDSFKSMYDPQTRKNKFTSGKQNKCPELWTWGVIQYDGTVIPCCLDDEGRGLGKITESGTFTDIWNNDNFVAARKAVSGKATDVINDCTRCRGKMKEL